MVWESYLNKAAFKKSHKNLSPEKKKIKDLPLLHNTAFALVYLDNLWLLEELVVL